MTPAAYYTLLNPAASLLFAAAFLMLWSYQRERAYLWMLCICYLASTFGFLLQAFDLPVGQPTTRMMSNAFFLGAALAMGLAMAWRYERPAPYLLLLGIAGIAMGVLGWYWFIEPNLVMRVYAANFAIGAMVLVTATTVAQAHLKASIDRVLLAMLVLQGVVFFGRTILTVGLGGLEGGADLHQSPYWMIFTFSHAILSMAVVFVLTTAAALDVFGDLADETETDALSGLMNRRGFERAAKEALQGASGRPLPMSLILSDLDRFKSINDSFGHHIGDQVIAIFARVLKDVVGEAHSAGRIGGEEFAVFVVGGDAATAELMAHGMRIGFSSAPTPGRQLGATRRLTASFGVAQWLRGETYEELLARADAALYAAKNDGRDCVSVAPNDQPAGSFSASAVGRALATPVVRRYRDSSSAVK